MKINHQPFDGGLGDLLLERLESGVYKRFDFMVAFAKQSGVLRFKDSIEKFRASGGSVGAVVGIDMDGTSSEALRSLRSLSDELHVVHVESPGQIFHSKIFSLSNSEVMWAATGSNNLTYAGMWANFEAWVTSEYRLDTVAGVELAKELKDQFDRLRDSNSGYTYEIKSEADIERLIAHGYMKTEHQINMKASRRRKSVLRTSPLFGTSVVHSAGPKLSATAESKSTKGQVSQSPSRVHVPHDGPMDEWVGEVFWSETGQMTSAARNQLDLSMKGRVHTGDASGTGYAAAPGWAVGSVAFFGVDPRRQSSSRNIRISYGGVDYYDNRVYFPDSQAANGSWRIQLNGTSLSGIRLDRVVGKNGFVQKVLAFQRVDEDYYSLSILPTSSISSLTMASTFSARNGGLGKLYGVYSVVE